MKFLWLVITIILLFFLNLFFGSVTISPSEIKEIFTGGGSEVDRFIVLGNRLPMSITALLSGAGLAVAGLLLQTAFRNPLAGPSILGINSGASLGVAIVMLFTGGTISAGAISIGGYAAIIIAAFSGSILIMAILLGLSAALKNNLMLLIAGIMIGYLVSSAITLLNFSASAQNIQSYVVWGMSSFNGVGLDRLPVFSIITVIGLVLAFLLMKPLDLLLLGDSYARNLGVNLTRVRNLLLLSTGVLTAVVTAFCGPVSFIGLAVPHIARLLFPTDIHRTLLPATALTGAAVALFCSLICVIFPTGVIPLNAVTPAFGAPVVLWVILRRK